MELVINIYNRLNEGDMLLNEDCYDVDEYKGNKFNDVFTILYKGRKVNKVLSLSSKVIPSINTLSANIWIDL